MQVVTAQGGTTSGYLSSTLILDPAANCASQWTPGPAMATERHQACLAELADGRILVVGGVFRASKTSEIFDPATGVWTAGPTLTEGRADSGCALLPDGRVIVTGGWHDAGCSTEILDLATMQSAPGPALPRAWSHHAAAVLPDSRIILISGDGDGLDSLDQPVDGSSTLILDPTTMRWTEGPAMSTVRAHAGAVVLGDGKIMVIGGDDTKYYPPVSLTSTEILDPTTMIWAAGPDLGVPRMNFGSAILPDGKIVVAGGSSHPGMDVSSTEVLDLGIRAPLQRAPLLDGPAVLAAVPECTAMPAAKVAVHLEAWLAAADKVKADPRQAKATGRAKLQAACEEKLSAAHTRVDDALQAAAALRDRAMAKAQRKYNATSIRVTQALHTERGAVTAARDQQLEEFDAAAETELAELLPEIEAVRAEQEDAVKMAASFRRRASKRPRQDDPPRVECAVCLDLPKDIVFQCGHRACGACAAELLKCHVCRVAIVQRIKTFD